MSNTAILYLRLLRKIVRESAWRLGGGEETFLAAGFGGDDGPVVHFGIARSLKAGERRETTRGQGQTRKQVFQTGEQA